MPTLEEQYRELAKLTGPKCGSIQQCLNVYGPQRCCSSKYCEIARNHAKTYYGIDPVETGHPTLPFMGPSGCTLEPHLRPVCTIHVCEMDMTIYKLRAQVLAQAQTEGKPVADDNGVICQ